MVMMLDDNDDDGASIESVEIDYVATTAADDDGVIAIMMPVMQMTKVVMGSHRLCGAGCCDGSCSGDGCGDYDVGGCIVMALRWWRLWWWRLW